MKINRKINILITYLNLKIEKFLIKKNNKFKQAVN